jgi:hypothetical protein
VSVNRTAQALFGFSAAKEAELPLSLWSEFFEATHLDRRPIEPSEWPIHRAFHGEVVHKL